MEIHAHQSREDTWDDAFQLALHILHEWFDDDLLDKADRVAGHFESATDTTAGDLLQWRDRLEARHLTEAQQRYAGRCYPKGPAPERRPPPWPAPERVPERKIQALASIVREEPPTSPKAWAAARVLGVAAVIEAANRADEVSRSDSAP